MKVGRPLYDPRPGRAARILRAFRRDGVRGVGELARRTVTRRLDRAADRAFDRKLGVDTSGRISLETLEIESPRAAHGVDYEGIAVRRFERALSSVPLDPSNYVFLDLGSGKGRALLLAARRGFRRVVGVEFSPELNEVARSNVRRAEALVGHALPIEILDADAAAYDLPREPLAVLLYNPFTRPVLHELAARLEASLSAAPRDVFLYYVNPVFRDVFDALPWLELVRDERGLCVYRASGGSTDARSPLSRGL